MNQHVKLFRSVKAAIAASRFDPRIETIRESIARGALTDDQMRWARQQRLIGSPSFTRLPQAMKMAGLVEVDIQLSESRERFELTFHPGPEVTAQTSDELMQLLIKTFRSAGFKTGWEDLGFTDVRDGLVYGFSSTTSVNDGPPPEPWQLPDDEYGS